MADMGTKEAAEKWGVPQSRVQRWCREGKIPNATQKWHALAYSKRCCSTDRQKG